MTKRLDRSNLQVSETLVDFIEKEALPNTNINAEHFWNKFEAVLNKFAPQNKKLLQIRTNMKNNIDEPLIIILTLNTIAHTVGAILVGVQAKEVYSSFNNISFDIFGIVLTEDLVVGIVSSVMTVLILLVSEIIPKTLGATYWHKLVRFTSVFLNSIIPVFKYSGMLFSFTRSGFNKHNPSRSTAMVESI